MLIGVKFFKRARTLYPLLSHGFNPTNARLIKPRGLNTTNKKSSEVQIEEIMSYKFRWVEPTTQIEDAVQKMLNNNSRRLLVLEDNKLVGVVTQTDLIEFLRERLLVDGTIKSIES